MINIQVKPKDRIKNLDEIMPKFTDKEEQKKRQTDEEMAASALAWAQALGAVDKRKKGAF